MQHLHLTESGRDKLARIAKNSSIFPVEALESLLRHPVAQVPYIVHPRPLFDYKNTRASYVMSLPSQARLDRQAEAAGLSCSDYVELILLLVGEHVRL